MTAPPHAMRVVVLAAAVGLALPVGTVASASLASAAGPDDVPEVAMDEPLDGLADELGPPGTPPATEAELDSTVRTISKGLRCPVCQGSSIQDSPVESAVNMRNRVRELVKRGYDQDQINAYFAARYGEWILQAPPAAGLNWLAWLGPAAAGGLALAVLAGVAARWRKEPDDVPLPSETGEAPLDTYEQRLLDEIDR